MRPPTPRFPQSYENVPVRRALEDLVRVTGADELPTLKERQALDALDTLLHAALKGGLVVDVTGSTPETGTHVRTIASTAGEPVLPLFTSMNALKQAVSAAGGAETPIQATIIPAKEALGLIDADEFVAVQFNPGTHAQVIKRQHIERALGRG